MRIFLIATVLLTGCASHDIEACKEAVKARLKSPASAKFGEAKLIPADKSVDFLSTHIDSITKTREVMARARGDAETDFAERELVKDMDSEQRDYWSARMVAQKEPISLVAIGVDSQNPMGAMMHAETLCGEKKGVADVISIRQR